MGTGRPGPTLPAPITTHQVHARTISERTGEGHLMLAVLEDAIASFRRYRGARDGRDQQLFEMERAWFTRDDAREPFAFATVCNALGLDRALLRRMLQVWEFEAAEPADPPHFADHRRALEPGAARRLAHERERLADIGAITARIVHDLGNPLAGLVMQAQLIVRLARRAGNQSTGALLAPAERIVSELHRLERLVKNFLGVAGKQRLAVRAVALPPFLRQLFEFWKPVAAAREIGMDLTVGNVPAIAIDEDKLRRALDNLVKNAVEAIDSGPGRVEVRATAFAADRVRIAIRDSGPGISQALELFRLFNTTKPGGLGLGLSIAREIIRAHGGDLGFERLMPRGTAFYVDLPVVAPASTPCRG